MRRLLYLLSFCFIGFIIYYDLTAGTLPVVNKTTIMPENKHKPPSSAPAASLSGSNRHIEIVIKPGDTILSIIEQREGKINEPIEKIISDFRSLNKGKDPEDIQIGKKYKIPSYAE
ncbi:LysM peptidoglycan-binding domain-containing protein [Peribacillus deserti]|uniref:LysM domain-containing protein n=1 Tax=Peribacillus deserti TaxID=673318 RepID=A0A2N5M9J0_9BACI|nr:LysM domain-containing protein [Peribacillus deserti]PLT30995.1 hypothetical protein CUU66_05455 [Peribacillus deserti]